jgi:hypothetical protein
MLSRSYCYIWGRSTKSASIGNGLRESESNSLGDQAANKAVILFSRQRRLQERISFQEGQKVNLRSQQISDLQRQKNRPFLEGARRERLPAAGNEKMVRVIFSAVGLLHDKIRTSFLPHKHQSGSCEEPLS